MTAKSIRFINERIQVTFNNPPTLEKKPGCPDGLKWQGKEYKIIEQLGEWHDYQRRGRMKRNMAPAHAEVAERRGSWGVGQDYYRVRIDTGQVLDIYYDRAPQDALRRKGEWFVYRELSMDDIPDSSNPETIQ